ncbi:hypothetical protein AcV5_008473 [Taiwanofungus camphoratus]|nr:hypothetical protein AcV5_008473 [Antrodia cinnamomea]KAI0955927.1 hypothetical protein AcV7_006464 [Antrodia cinnamomea]
MQGALADSPVVSVGALGRRNDVTGAPDVMPVSTALFRSRPRPWTLQLPTTIFPFITTTTTTASQVMAALTSRSALRSVAAFSRPTAACTPRFSSSVHGNDPHVLETEKHRNLSKNQHKTSTTIPSAPGWNEYLASASEAAVKADRSSSNYGDMHADRPSSDIGDMQSTTVKHIKDRHHTAETQTAAPQEQALNTDRMREGGADANGASREAAYSHDEVSGPLKGARGQPGSVTNMAKTETYGETITLQNGVPK